MNSYYPCMRESRSYPWSEILASPLRIAMPRAGPLRVFKVSVDVFLFASCSLNSCILFGCRTPSSVLCNSCLVLLPEFGSSSTDFGIELIVRGLRRNISTEKVAEFIFRHCCTVCWLLVPELLAAVDCCSLDESNRCLRLSMKDGEALILVQK